MRHTVAAKLEDVHDSLEARVTGRIFLLDNDSRLMPMDEAPYDSEKLLQELLAKYPDLLAGEQINSDQPRRWVLVTREMGVPGEEDGGGRWSLDHLFLDQDAIPTLIEVKRSSDSRIRREVIGQMLDYAANAVVYWPVEEIKAKFEARCQTEKRDAVEALLAFLESEQALGEFWQRVKTNLQAGRIRMVFVADTISPELRRIVEFLNEQMDPAEVLAVEVKQFVGNGMKTLVPPVFGQTESAVGKKGGGSARQPIGEAEFLSLFDTGRSSAEQNVARQLIAWAGHTGLSPEFTRGQKVVSFIPVFPVAERLYYPISLQTRGVLVFQMRWLRPYPPFDDEHLRDDLFHRLQQLPDLIATDAARDGFPKVPVASLTQPATMSKCLEILDWLIDEIRRT